MSSLLTGELERTRSFAPGGEWFDQLCRWLRRPLGDVGPLGWPVLLVPELVDGVFALPEHSLQVYQRVTWQADVPHDFEVTARPAWVSKRAGSVEIGIETVATAGGGALADALLVARTEGDGASFGQRRLPPVPKGDHGRRRLSLVVEESDIRLLADLAGTRYPIHDDVRYAQRLGFPNVLVQGLLLLLVQMHHAGVGAQGAIEMWFQQPVPAGSLLELWQGEGDEWSFRLAGRSEPAAMSRLTTA